MTARAMNCPNARLGVSLLLLALWGMTPAQADWFKTLQQTADDAYRAGDFETAATSFRDPYRRGVALYRGGRYADAERSFGEAAVGPFREAARYNQGNARFQQGDLAGAAEAYQEVLSRNPSHEDAAYNLALTRAALARMEQEAFRDQRERPNDQADAAQAQRESGAGEKAARETAESASPQTPGDRRERPPDQSEQKESRQAQESSGSEPSKQQAQSGQPQSEQRESSQQERAQPSDQGEPQSAGEDGSDAKDESGGATTSSTSGGGTSGTLAEQSAQGDSGQTSSGQGGGQEMAPGSGLETEDADGQDSSGKQPSSSAGGESGSESERSEGDRKKSAELGRGNGVEPREPASALGGQHNEAAERGAAGTASRPRSGAGSEASAPPASPEQGGQQGDGQGDRASAEREADWKAAGGDEPRHDASGGALEGTDQSGSFEQGRGQDGVGSDRADAERREAGQGREDRADASGIGLPSSQGRKPPPTAPDRIEGRDQRAVETFDQLGHRPEAGSQADPVEGRQPALDSAHTMAGAGMAVMEQRLDQLQDDPGLLIRNQFRVEEMREIEGMSGPWQETRPW